MDFLGNELNIKMTLDDTIASIENQYQDQLNGAEAVKRCHGEHSTGYRLHLQHANECKQLIEWLKELRDYRNEAR